ncbi:MAG: hypothetical protein CL610_00145 [Anaerolineaceae bacterium]|nr:hypothetical protein [Anaerolineaceae bacterium]
MIPVHPNSESHCNLERFTPEQAQQARAILEYAVRRFEHLTAPDRVALTNIWTLLARASAPVSLTGMLSGAKQRYDHHMQSALPRLINTGLVWYDEELKSVLQCPPFSALTTRHQVKAFGWNPAYVCTFLDGPLSLLLYGPNVWLQINSKCQRSGDELQMRIRWNNENELEVEAPDTAEGWYVWVRDVPETPPPHGQDTNAPRTALFHTRTDLETNRHYHPEQTGLAYSLADAVYLGECLLNTCKAALTQ